MMRWFSLVELVSSSEARVQQGCRGAHRILLSLSKRPRRTFPFELPSYSQVDLEEAIPSLCSYLQSPLCSHLRSQCRG